MVDDSGGTTSRITDEDAQRLRQTVARDRLVSTVFHRDGAEAVPLRQGVPVTVGREAPVDVAIADESLSRRHAKFTREGDDVVVEDFGSTNGTWIRDERVTRAVVPSGQLVGKPLRYELLPTSHLG